LTWWDGDDDLPSDSRRFGHLAYTCDNDYELCQRLMDSGVTIHHRPPRDGHMAFVAQSDSVSIELLLQAGGPLRKPPWASMETPVIGKILDPDCAFWRASRRSVTECA
jgi:lactoylglutathione lyase